MTGSLVLHLRKTCGELKELDLARCKSIDGASVRRVFESCPALQSLNVSFLETAVLSDALEVMMHVLGPLRHRKRVGSLEFLVRASQDSFLMGR